MTESWVLFRMVNESLPTSRYSLIFFAAICVLMFSNIWGLSIYAYDEAKNATAAAEMLRNSSWIVPTFNEAPRYDKPPLHYYFFILSYLTFGIGEFAARFFPALMGIWTTWLTYKFICRYTNRDTAFWVLPIFIASIHCTIQFHLAVPDPFLIAFLTCSLIYGFRFYDSGYKEMRAQYICYTTLAFAFLSKGPIAVILFGLTIFAFLLARRDFSLAPWFRPLPILVFLAIALPWYILVYIKTDGIWLKEFFLTHNLGRFKTEMEGHGGGFWLILVFVALGLFPFSFYLPAAAKYGLKTPSRNGLEIFLTVAGSIPIIFFMFSGTKLPNYTAPAYPFLIGLISLYLGNKNTVLKKMTQFWFGLTLSIFVIALPVGLYIGIGRLDYLKESINSVWLFLLSFPIAAYSWRLFWKKKYFHQLIAGSITTGIVSLLFLWFVFPRIDPKNPVSASLDLVNQNKDFYFFRAFNPAYSFYLQKPVMDLESRAEIPTDAYLITRKSLLAEFEKLDISHRIIFEGNDLFEGEVSVLIQLLEE